MGYLNHTYFFLDLNNNSLEIQMHNKYVQEGTGMFNNKLLKIHHEHLLTILTCAFQIYDLKCLKERRRFKHSEHDYNVCFNRYCNILIDALLL